MVSSAGGTAISGSNTGNMCSMSGDIGARDEFQALLQSIRAQGGIYLFGGKKCTLRITGGRKTPDRGICRNRLIPECNQPGTAVRVTKIGMCIIDSGVYHGDQDSFSGQAVACVFLDSTQAGGLPGRNNFKEKLSGAFDIDDLGERGQFRNVIF